MIGSHKIPIRRCDRILLRKGKISEDEAYSYADGAHLISGLIESSDLSDQGMKIRIPAPPLPKWAKLDGQRPVPRVKLEWIETHRQEIRQRRQTLPIEVQYRDEIYEPPKTCKTLLDAEHEQAITECRRKETIDRIRRRLKKT